MNVLTIGGATYDVIIHYNAERSCSSFSVQEQHVFSCPEGSKIPVKKLEYACGGGATNSAVSFHRLGNNVTSCFSVGNDSAGDFVIQLLQNEGVRAVAQKVSEIQTGTSFIIPSPNKDRLIFAYHGANINFDFSFFNNTFSEFYDVVYFTALHGKAARALPEIVATFKKKYPSCIIAINPGKNQLLDEKQFLKASLHACDVVLLNAQEMHLCMSLLKSRYFKTDQLPFAPKESMRLLSQLLAYESITFTLQDYFKELFSYGVKKAVVTDGAHGVYVGTHNAIYFYPALTGEVVNTLGAGDAFGSAFVASLASYASTEQALYAGLVQAQSVISYQDAQTGLLDHIILQKKIADFDYHFLKKYSL